MITLLVRYAALLAGMDIAVPATDQQVVRLIAEFMDSTNRNGEDADTVWAATQRALRKAGLPQSFIVDAADLLDRQGRC